MARQAPWRDVKACHGLYEGRGGLLGPDTNRRTRWHELTLTCGHRVQRTVRYRPRPKDAEHRSRARTKADVLPPPRRVRCEFCR